MAKKKKKRRFVYLEYMVFRLLFAVFRALPIDTALALSRMAGYVVYLLDRTHRKVAMQNLHMAFDGQLSERKLRRIAHGVYKHLVMTGAEILKMDHLLRPDTWRRYVTFENEHIVHDIIKSGRGAIFITGHIGNWEMNAYIMYLLGHPLHSVARELENPLLEQYIKKFRRRLGQDITGKKGALRKMVQLLKENKFLGMVVDQDGGKNGVFVDFFGRKASWVASPAALSLRFNVPIIPAYSWRTGKRFRYKIFVDDPIEPVNTGDREADIRRIISEYAKRMEGYVRAHPEQWLWNHRRWKTRPPEELEAAAADKKQVDGSSPADTCEPSTASSTAEG